MSHLRALRPLSYGGRRFRPGDEFIARNARDAKVLVAGRRAATVSVTATPVAAPVAPAVEMPGQQAEAIRVPEVESAAPESAEPEPAPDDEEKPRRRYRRRDMEAVDQGGE